MSKKIAIELFPWDGGDSYIISMAPECEPSWKRVPIGYEVGKKDGKIIERWLKAAMPELQKIILQVEADPSIPKEEG